MAIEGVDSDAEDYMNMSFADSDPVKAESSLQRRARLKREGELKGRVQSKAEREAEEKAKRELALATSLDDSNKGFKIMAKLGFAPGNALGKTSNARTVPIEVSIKEGRGGIGIDSGKRKRLRDAAEESSKRAKVDVDGYRQQVRDEHEERRLHGLIVAAQKTAERLEEDSDTLEIMESKSRSLKSIDVTWRGLVKARRREAAIEKAEHDLRHGLEKLPSYVDETEDDTENRWAQSAGAKPTDNASIEAEIDESDDELDAFQSKPLTRQFEDLTRHLREVYRYCFWCKYQYPDPELEGCPGKREEDHD